MNGRCWFPGLVVLCVFLIPISGHAQAIRPTPDFDGNGVVAFADFLLFVAGFGSRQGDANWNPALDIDQDGEVGFSDFLIFAASFGKVVDTLPEAITVDLPGDAQMAFVYIGPGTFLMGSPEGEIGRRSDEGPQHQVTITRGFYLGKYEVTQEQWQAVMGTAPWSGRVNVEEHPDHPAVHVSWNDVQEFVEKLNQAAGSDVYRLPTEAEWEYACRAGTTTRWSFGEDENKLGDYAWYRDNTVHVGGHPVGTKLPNPWGLYDMHGNVWEWCLDGYDWYSGDTQTDPQGSPRNDLTRVFRGGPHSASAGELRSARRNHTSVTDFASHIGFRLLRKVE